MRGPGHIFSKYKSNLFKYKNSIDVSYNNKTFQQDYQV